MYILITEHNVHAMASGNLDGTYLKLPKATGHNCFELWPIPAPTLSLII